jgi:hypothetical protein
MTDPILQFFGCHPRAPDAEVVTKPFALLAQYIADNLPQNRERTVSLRKLLEARDAAVRAAVYQEPLDR